MGGSCEIELSAAARRGGHHRRERGRAAGKDSVTDKPKRGYSREFPLDKTGPRRRLEVDWAPPGLLRDAKRKAKREGTSLRTLVLGWLQRYVRGEL